MGKSFWVYILASQRNGTLYIGVTSDLIKRIWGHKEDCAEFTKKYNVKKLVYFEKHDNNESAIKKEKLLKFWKRKWKLDLIEKTNPNWGDLYHTIIQGLDPVVKPQDDERRGIKHQGDESEKGSCDQVREWQRKRG